MTPHLQFLILIFTTLALTAPFAVLAWRLRLPHRGLVIGLYIAGFGLIIGTYVVDSVVNPPLFYHGFVPGIGIGLLVGGLGQASVDRRQMRARDPIRL